MASVPDRLEVKDHERADLAKVAEKSISDVFPLAEKHGCEIVLANNEEPTLVKGSADAISLALCNLIENSIYHAGPGIIEVSIGPGPTLTVRDYGSGLPIETSKELFEPFNRGHSAPRGGAGLGLAIISRIQRAHTGGVEAENAPDGGAVFKLSYMAA